MVFDIKSVRDINTINLHDNKVYTLFIDDKLFIDNDKHTMFKTPNDAWSSLKKSSFWKEIQRYIDHSQKFFNKSNDPEWHTQFESRVIDKLNIKTKEYIYNE